MAETETFAELQDFCREITDDVACYSIAKDPHFITSMQEVAVDAQAFALLPADSPVNYMPMVTVGDGNCFPRSLSMLCFGTQEFHPEMRVRLVVEMVVNSQRYLCPEYLAQGTADDGVLLLQLLKLYSETYNERFSDARCLQEDVFRVRQQGKDCGMWHVYGACNVMQCPYTLTLGNAKSSSCARGQ